MLPTYTCIVMCSHLLIVLISILKYMIQLPNSLLVAAYNGFRTLPIEYFPLASPAERQVGSPYLNLAPYSKLAACAFYGTQLLHLDMFIPAFLRRLPFYAHTNTTFNGITVERFYLNKSILIFYALLMIIWKSSASNIWPRMSLKWDQRLAV